MITGDSPIGSDSQHRLSDLVSANTLQTLATDRMPLAEPPPRGSRFGSPLVLSRVHWVRPEMVVEVRYVEWNLRVCSGTSSTWASAKISWPATCAAAHLMLAKLNPYRAGPTDLRRRH